MNHAAALLLLLCVPAAAGCFQSLNNDIVGPAPLGGNSDGSKTDASVADGAPAPPPDAGSVDTGMAPATDAGAAADGSAPSGDDGGGGLPLCNNGNIIDPAGSPTFCTDNLPGQQVIDTQTPGVELPDGATTVNPCDLVEQESLAIRQTYCAACHSHPGIPSAPFHDMLEDNYPNGSQTTLPDGGPTLLGTLSGKVHLADGGLASIVAPGDPANSVLLQRILAGTMPPVVGINTLPKPNVSDIALLQAWVQNMPTCFNIGSGGGGGGGGGGDAGGD